MVPGLHEVAAVCKTVLGGLDLDDDTLEYVAGCVVDEDTLLPQDDLADLLLPYVGEGDAEEAAAELAGRLGAALARQLGLAGAEPGQKEEGPAPALDGVTLGSLVKESDLDAYEVTQGRAQQHYIPAAAALDAGLPKEDAADSAAAAARAKAKAEVKDIQAAAKRAERAAAESAALNAEVEAAGRNAAELRGMKGFNFNAAITVGPFDLPHPSGAGNLIENATFTLVPGRKYALIGRNGKGKSTLLRNIAARRVGGIHPAVSTHYVSQDVNFSATAMDLSPLDVVLQADIERRVLLDKAQEFQASATAKNNEEYRACLSQLDAIDADSAGVRARRLLVNLGFSDELLDRKTRALSGGWRVRVALAAALFAKPDVLFLDEPTNHLSMQAVLWLAHEISSNPTWSKRIVILVSHDRFFINETCTDMLHISGVARRLTQSKGSYTSWARAREEQQRGFAHRSKVRLDEIAKCKAYIASGQAAAGNTASSGRRLQIQKLEREGEEEAEELKALQEDKDLPLAIHSSGALDKAALSLENVAFAYSGAKPLFRGVGNQPHEFHVTTSSRIVLVGENGNGKTTLVKLLLGELEPTEGEVVRYRGARFAIVNQHHADQIDLTMTPLQFIRRKAPGDGSEAWERFLRCELSNSGIDSSLVDTPAAALSGGQRSRLAMVAVSVTKPHVLFMDEPTNNLDVSAVEALAAAIEQFEGGVVLVSHDQYFVSRVAREVWTVGGGEVRPCGCGFEEYWARMLCAVDPGSAIATEALEAYARKKRVSQAYLTGGQASREALAKELAELRAGGHQKPP